MTNQQIADMALKADQQRRAAWARGDYSEAREYREERNRWILQLDGNYQNEAVVVMFRRG